VPLYYVPRLFVSRAPVAAESVTDRTGTYRIEVRDGLRFVLPEVPVALFPSLAKIAALGYRRFLVDLSFEKPSKHLFERLVRKAASGEAEQPSTAFNMKRGLT
jgi:putative protease